MSRSSPQIRGPVSFTRPSWLWVPTRERRCSSCQRISRRPARRSKSSCNGGMKMATMKSVRARAGQRLSHRQGNGPTVRLCWQPVLARPGERPDLLHGRAGRTLFASLISARPMLDIPVESSQSNEECAFAANTERIPAPGTPVRHAPLSRSSSARRMRPNVRKVDGASGIEATKETAGEK